MIREGTAAPRGSLYRKLLATHCETDNRRERANKRIKIKALLVTFYTVDNPVLKARTPEIEKDTGCLTEREERHDQEE